MRSEQASVASALRPGVQGPAQGPLVGSRGNAPVGVKGAKPPEAPGLVHFKNQYNALTEDIFTFIKRCEIPIYTLKSKLQKKVSIIDLTLRIFKCAFKRTQKRLKSR